MKEFNLKEYLANPSKKLVTRDRKEARIVCTDRKTNEGYPILALVKINNIEYCYSYTKKGEFSANRVHINDLFFASEKHEGWINVYRNGEHLWCGDIKRTEAEAKEFEDSEFYITSIKIEWEE